MRDFTKVSPTLWHSKRFNGLPSDEGRHLYLYLLTNEHQNNAGCYRLRDGTACDDLQWPREKYLEARKALIEADMVHFDPEASVIRITGWFQHNPPMNDSHYIGIERTLERCASEMLAEEALAELYEVQEKMNAVRLKKQVTPQGASGGHLQPAKGPPNRPPTTLAFGGTRR